MGEASEERDREKGKAVIADSKSHLPSLPHLGKLAPLSHVPQLFLQHKSYHKHKTKVRTSSLRN